MNYLQDIASLIQVRNFLQGALDNLGVNLSTTQIKDIRNRITLFDQVIVNKSLSLDLNRTKLTDKETTEYNFTSSEDTAEVLSRLLSTEKQHTKKIKAVKSNETAK